ncbi:type ISP restriction/modification enzyme [Halocola ammonii]
MTVHQYVEKLNTRYKSGISREHSYRGDLQNLLEELVPDALITNEPARIDCGAPDYILTKKKIPVGYIEAKDIGADLGSKTYKEQFERYRESLDNLIITNYHDFWLYRNGELVKQLSIAEVNGKEVTPLPDQFESFENMVVDFASTYGQTIKSAQKLSKMMANKARLMKEVFENTLEADLKEEQPVNPALLEQYTAFKDILIHNISPKGFADIYAQTIAYGMFAARLHDPTLDDFSRYEAASLIPKSNPFLRKLFQYIAGYDLDSRLSWIVDDLSDVFRATNVADLLKDFGKATAMNDPIIHFYETFLAEYDPKLRKSRGVWYTPEPVVNFIVRAVDDILKDEFGLKDGLADTGKVKIKRKVPKFDKRTTKAKIIGEESIDEEVHRVQILDPATGTGTFLAEVVKQIHQRFKGQEGIWSQYVDNHLLPRLNGFEILMASYAMAHLKLDLLLTETGYKPQTDQRLRVYLTNSLEEHHPDTGTLFANWLSSEANEANHIKRDTPVMCVIGNPPYSGESQNKGKWIMNLMEDYKKEPGGKEKLNERNPKWINDDYVKFIRYSQYFIEKNGEGILAFINPHGFLDNPTFRGMRWNLLRTYDKIYTIDLHGNSKKKETTPDGSKDENVFDIMQGVSINLFVKTGRKKNSELGKVFHLDLYGDRQRKYETLASGSVNTLNFIELPMKLPMYFMVQKNFELQDEYNQGVKLNELFNLNSIGIVTSRDSFVIDRSRHELETRIENFFRLDKSSLIQKYSIRENKSWKIENVQAEAKVFDPSVIKPISYRPFDNQWIYYEPHFVERSRIDTMQHIKGKRNISLLCPKAFKDESFAHIFVSRIISEAIFLSPNTGSNAMNFPLYLYPEETIQSSTEEQKRRPNLNKDIVGKFLQKLKMEFVDEPEDREKGKNMIAPIDLLDYIYSVLHSPTYREKYKEFLKIDFPRVPYPEDPEQFWQLVNLGGELRQIHLLEHPIVEDFITTYPEAGDNIITRKITKTSPGFEPTDETHGKVWINDDQYFDKVPLVAWEFYIGGYQPAQKWLKDRKGRELSIDDIRHYQKIIVALAETDRIMREVDGINLTSSKPS